ncbi:MAG: hypothetical protein HYV47_00555 [Candidatus Nealsonbacteria bacterium]|nr:hypothetical protein [Candidatus Nealsonbacteria bacterium]
MPTHDTAELLGFSEKNPYTAVRTQVNLDEIILLPQPRKTFEEIPELGMSILFNKLIYLPVLAYFNKEQFKRYLSILSELWRVPLSIENYLFFGVHDIEKGEIYYKVLIDGERRVRACRYYQQHGCDEHADVRGCYKLHFGNEKVEATLCLNISPIKALGLQSTANSHNRVPAHEDAVFLDQFFRMILICDQKYPITRFAKLVGRSPETIRNAIKFCLLPEEIRNMVPAEIPYGIACEVARLHNFGVSEAELKGWVMMTIVQKQKIPDFRKVVNDFMRQQQSGQTTLFDLFSDKQRAELEKRGYKLIVSRHMINAVWQWINYFDTLLCLFEEGKLGKEDSPFSIKSPLKVFKTLIEKEKKLLPHLECLLPEKKYKEAKITLEKAESLIIRLESISQQ